MNKEIIYRSSWEKKFIEYMDGNQDIVSFKEDPFRIEYFYDQKRNYIPDFLVEYKNGNKELIEIKPEAFKKYKRNKLKFAAGRQYCKQNGLKYRVLTEKYLRYIGLDI